MQRTGSSVRPAYLASTEYQIFPFCSPVVTSSCQGFSNAALGGRVNERVSAQRARGGLPGRHGPALPLLYIGPPFMKSPCSSEGRQEIGRVVVAVRCRPLEQRSCARGARVLDVCGRKVVACDPVESAAVGGDSLTSGENPWRREFTFDACYDDDAGAQQEAIFEGLGLPLLKHAWAGYDCSLLAYGQTGAGKTYSMQGTEEEPGLIPRVCAELFDAIGHRVESDDVTVEASYMEIYNEGVRDLLLPTGKALRVREHPRDGAHVPELTTVRVSRLDELSALAAVGARARATAPTRVNARSSRSHAVFTLTVHRRRRAQALRHRTGRWWDEADHEQQHCASGSTRARVRLVDLAGSERCHSLPAGARLREAKSINKSLATLCDVIEALGANSVAERKRRSIAASLDLQPDEDVGSLDEASTFAADLRQASFMMAGDTVRVPVAASIASVTSSVDATGSTTRSLGARDDFKRRFVPYRNSTLTWLLKDSLGGNSMVTMLACVSPAEANYEETMATLKYAERAKRVRTSARANVILADSGDLPQVPPTPELPPERNCRNGATLTDPYSSRLTRKTWPNLTNLNPDPEFAGCRVWPLSDGVTVVGSGPAATVRLAGGELLHKHALIAAALEDASDPESRFVVLVGLAGALVHVDGHRLDTAERCDALVLRHGSRVVFAGLHAFRFEQRRDDDRFDRLDPTTEWRQAQHEVQSSSIDPDQSPEVDMLTEELHRLPPNTRARILAQVASPRQDTNALPAVPRPMFQTFRNSDDSSQDGHKRELPTKYIETDKADDPELSRHLADTRRRMDIAQAQCVHINCNAASVSNRSHRRLDAILGTCRSA